MPASEEMESIFSRAALETACPQAVLNNSRDNSGAKARRLKST